MLLDWLRLAEQPSLPLYRQIYLEIRNAILDGRLPPGERLPASRDLCHRLKVSRITVQQAYDQLGADGLLEAHSGAGTHVSSSLDAVLDRTRRRNWPGLTDETRDDERVPQPNALGIAEPAVTAFRPGIPAFDTFPRNVWARLLRRHALRHDQFIQDYAHPGGYQPLKAALVRYLAGSRGVICSPEQIIIVTTARAATVLAARMRGVPEASAVVEDPCYYTGRICLEQAGLTITPVPVDAEGIRVDRLYAENIDAALAYVTPTNQWPTCVTLPLDRRVALIDWAKRHGTWIIEDDYDSEFSMGQPPTALYSLSEGDNVIFLGTFSKTLLPSIRCAYLVVPPQRADEFADTAYYCGCEPGLHIQAALADFLAEGHFTNYIRRMRKIYAVRRQVLTEALEAQLGHVLRARPGSGGLQLVVDLVDGVPAREVSLAAARAQIALRPLEEYYVSAPPRNALHLGFAAVPETEIASIVAQLADAIASRD